MKVEIRDYQDGWQLIKDATMTTIGYKTGIYPDSKWKTKLLRSEHSPIRLGQIVFRITDTPNFVIGHLVRHHNGVEKFVSTLRADRGHGGEIITRDTPNGMMLVANFNAIINISKVRLCKTASKETRETWMACLEAIKDLEPELYNLCVPSCIYRGYCPEMFPCGYSNTEEFEEALEQYRKYKK